MTENTFQRKLDELQEQVRALQHFSKGDSAQLRKSLPRVVEGLQQSLKELQDIVIELPESPRASSNVPARSTRKRPVGGYLGTSIASTGHTEAEKYLALQYAVARLLAEAKTLDQTVAPILQMVCESLGWELGELWSVDSKDREPHFVRFWASSSIDVSTLGEGMWSRVFPPFTDPSWQSGDAVWIADMSVHEVLAHEPEVQRVGLRGMFRLPVLVHGEIRAILRFFCREVRQQDDAVVQSLMAAGSQIGQALERQRSVQKVLEAEARKVAILEASLDAVITIDHEGTVVEFNSAAETIFGYRREQAIGNKLGNLIVPPRMRDQALAGLASYLAEGESGMPVTRFGACAMKADRSEFPVEVAIAPTRGVDQPLLTIYICDASARKHADREVKLYQERVRSLMTDLLLAEEHERRRLAVDLHDGLSQTIALTQIKLSELRRSVDGKLAKSLDEIEALIVQSNRAARSISFELSPPILHDLGLEPAVQWLVENIQTRYGIKIDLEVLGHSKPTDEKTRVVLFRSIRELLINAAKHAKARRVRVSLECKADQLNAAIDDDGVGMSSDVEAAQGSGLFSIRERLSHVGGSMRIESTPGRGTKIRLSAPLANGKSKRDRVTI